MTSPDTAISFLAHRRAWRHRVLLCGLLLTLGADASQARFYRWVDEDGVVHYSDTLPPNEIQRGHAELSDNGVQLETVPPVKTPEELARDRELERMRAEQQRLIDAQAADDALLLRTYPSADDIALARSTKLESINSAIEMKRSMIRLHQRRLIQLYGEAADLERAGKPVSEELQTRIERAETAISEAYTRILNHERQRQEVRAKFDHDLARYHELIGDTGASDQRTLSEAYDTPGATMLDNVVTCADSDECDRLWPLAVAYVRSHAATPTHLAGDRLIVTAAPRQVNDVSLILSRIADKEGSGESLFLDVQCYRQGDNARPCQDTPATDLVTGFRAALGKDKPAAEGR